MKADLQINGQTAAVQAAADDAVLLLLDEYKKAISARLAKGDLDDMKLASLTKELRGLLHAIKKPNSTLMYMAAPALPQGRDTDRRRHMNIIKGVAENHDRLLESQDAYIDKHGENPES